jgi:hypothetical protein
MTAINQDVTINSFYFKGHEGETRIESYPRQMEFGNRQYTFHNGMRQLVNRGQRMFELFDMTDGQTVFRLARRSDNPSCQWRLIGTRTAMAS